MQGANRSAVTEFILIGFSISPHLQLVFFVLFLLMYLFTLLGNLLIMATVWSERSLHTPMHLFLCALSVSEVLYTVAIIPRMLADLLSAHRSITLPACAGQMFSSFTFGFTHSFLLTVMGYDRYVAICHPLRYHVLMSPRGCACLVGCSWAGGSVMGMVVTTAIFQLSFCGSNEIHHFACDVPWVAKGVGLVCITALLGCFLLILLSYAFIVATIFRIPSAEGRHKAFSLCVPPHCGPHSVEGDTLMGTTYMVLTPFLSPIIFSLRNKELKVTLRKTFLRNLGLSSVILE
uniref:G-protein coupled receptors family 1 profile domain-containing protein n=1 Tax=Prolemur simus TaxID=1328070 RepID=A0A8C8Z7R0_PROSS